VNLAEGFAPSAKKIIIGYYCSYIYIYTVVQLYESWMKAAGFNRLASQKTQKEIE
jgi:hypothetical protein